MMNKENPIVSQLKPIDIIAEMAVFSDRYANLGWDSHPPDISLVTITRWIYEVKLLRSENTMLQKLVANYERAKE